MLGWVVLFLIIAIVAGLFGFRGVESTAVSIAKIIFVLAIILFLLSLFFQYRPF